MISNIGFGKKGKKVNENAQLANDLNRQLMRLKCIWQQLFVLLIIIIVREKN